MPNHKVVCRDEWLAARKQHSGKEKEFTRLRDQLSAEHSDRQLGECAARKGSRRRGVPICAGQVFRATLGFRKIADSWTITQQHSSVPFYMDGSFKAAIDLKP
ncbi:MAG: hypothetical protein QOF64_2509 [Candidatus Binatota bacterium]|jgi:ketosteroid isomerase-like protein|nr:hypothetical protein [Candidatus Binatota bacterium]